MNSKQWKLYNWYDSAIMHGWYDDDPNDMEAIYNDRELVKYIIDNRFNGELPESEDYWFDEEYNPYEKLIEAYKNFYPTKQ